MGIKTQADLIQAFIDKHRELLALQKDKAAAKIESRRLESIILDDTGLVRKIRAGGIVGIFGEMISITRGETNPSLLVLSTTSAHSMDDQLSASQIQRLNDGAENE